MVSWASGPGGAHATLVGAGTPATGSRWLVFVRRVLAPEASGVPCIGFDSTHFGSCRALFWRISTRSSSFHDSI